MPEISAIIPVYKVEPYLRRCVDSILAQSFTDFELILVDDGSPDGCPAICDEYAQKDSRVHVIHQQNGGLSAARNAGIDWAFANSDSQWLTFVDSDDWVHSRYLETLLDAAKSLGAQIAACYCHLTTTESEEQEDIEMAQLLCPEDYWTTVPFPVHSTCKLFNKDRFLSLRFPEGRLHEDQFTTYRALFSVSTIASIPTKLYYYFQSPSGITRSQWTPKRLDDIVALEEQLEFFERDRYFRALDTARNRYVQQLANFWLDAKAYTGPSSSAICVMLVRKLRRAMWRYHRDIQVAPETKEWLWGICYPKTVRFVSILRAIKNRFIPAKKASED